MSGNISLVNNYRIIYEPDYVGFDCLYSGGLCRPFCTHPYVRYARLIALQAHATTSGLVSNNLYTDRFLHTSNPRLLNHPLL